MEGEKERIKVASDKYRKFLHEEQAATAGSIHWRHGGPPIYDAVNNLFEQGRTKVCITLSFNLFFVKFKLLTLP